MMPLLNAQGLSEEKKDSYHSLKRKRILADTSRYLIASFCAVIRVGKKDTPSIGIQPCHLHITCFK